jgi:hypothetical protein
MGRPRKYQHKPLQREASGNCFRYWLEDQLHDAPGVLGDIMWEAKGKPPTAIVDFLEERTNVDQRQLRKYLTSVKSASDHSRSAGNPKVETAVQIAQGIRDLSPYASPLMMLYRVDRFKPHAWGVIGTICAPGPTSAVMEIWPALRWMIQPKIDIQDDAFRILLDAGFNATFDRAWKEWNKSNSTARFPDALSRAIDHAREAPLEMWDLTRPAIEDWADWVTRDPSAFGLGMRMLDGRSLSARDAFERAIEHWEKYKTFDGNAIMINRPYLIALMESEQQYLRSRVKAIFEANDHWRRFADHLD